jgi:hypothetical protein
MTSHAKALDHAAAFRARFTKDTQTTPTEPSGTSPWLDSLQAAEQYCAPNRRAFRAWARRAGIVPVHRGTRLLYAKRDVDAALVKRQSTKNGGAR